MRKSRYTQEQWKRFDGSMLWAAHLGFRVGSNAFYVGRCSKNGKNVYNEPLYKFKYTHIDFNDGIGITKSGKQYSKAFTHKLMTSYFGSEPLFDTPRTPIKYNNVKHGNVISSIGHPDLHAFDFDNHFNISELSVLMESFYYELKKYPDLLIGTKPGFAGLHIFCLSKDKPLVEKYKAIFEKMGGHVDIFNSNRHNAIGIPGFDHYLYHRKDVCHFAMLLGVEVHVDKRIDQFLPSHLQPIEYRGFSKQTKQLQETIQQQEERIKKETLKYQKAKLRTKAWETGRYQPVCTPKEQKISADQYVKNLSKSDKHDRTEILLRDKEKITHAISTLKITDIETFMLKYPDFESNHYKIIEQIMAYIKDNKKTERHHLKDRNEYTELVAEVQKMTNSIPEIKNSKNSSGFLSVASYLVFCMKLNLDQPGYIHYLNFCRFNNLPEVAEKTYYRHYNKCIDIRLFGLRRDYYKIGKYCRTIFKGTLYLIEEFRQKVKATSRELVIFNQKGSGCLSFFHIILCTVKQGLKEGIGRYEKLSNFDLQSLLMRISV